MRLPYRITIGCLVGLFFAAGYAARLTSPPERSSTHTYTQRALVSAPGTTVASVGNVGGGSVDLRPLETLYFVLSNLRQHYVEQITEETEGKMSREALRAMLASLDDYSTRFVEPASTQCIEDSMEGKFHGIGAVLGIKRMKTGNITDEHLIVIAPVISGPAAEAGIQPGDDIVAVDGKDVLPFDPYQKANALVKAEVLRNGTASKLKKKLEVEKERIDGGVTIFAAENQLSTQDDKEIELLIARKGSAKPIKVTLKPREFTIAESVTSSVTEAEKIGYIKVNCLSNETGDLFGEALARIARENANALVLDLRNVAGGQVESILAIAKHLMPGKQLATLMQSRGRKTTIMAATANGEQIWHGPLIVLVNQGTARMAEVLAAGIKDNHIGKLVGEKTYGDFGHVVINRLRDGSAVSITTGIFKGKNGVSYNDKGVPVDVTAASSGSGDPQLKEAIKLLSAEVGRS